MSARWFTLFALIFAAPACAAETEQAPGGEYAWMMRFCEKAARPDRERSTSSERPLSAGDPDHDRLSVLLPPPPTDWTGNQPAVAAFASDTIGCGARASRNYSHGSTAVDLMVTVSPVVPILLNDPRARQGLKQNFKVRGRPGFAVTDGTIMVVTRHIVVSAQGSAIEADKLAILGAVDFDAVERFGR